VIRFGAAGLDENSPSVHLAVTIEAISCSPRGPAKLETLEKEIDSDLKPVARACGWSMSGSVDLLRKG